MADSEDYNDEIYLKSENTGVKFYWQTKLYENKLKELLGNHQDHRISLALVESNKSEQISQWLLNCEIPVVITINFQDQKSQNNCS